LEVAFAEVPAEDFLLSEDLRFGKVFIAATAATTIITMIPK